MQYQGTHVISFDLNGKTTEVTTILHTPTRFCGWLETSSNLKDPSLAAIWACVERRIYPHKCLTISRHSRTKNHHY